MGLAWVIISRHLGVPHRTGSFLNFKHKRRFRGLPRRLSQIKLSSHSLKMQTPAAAAPAPTYTTIPISGPDVISRSTQNLRAALCRYRPWPEFLATISALDFPRSLSEASLRFRRNSRYFSVNYAVIISACAAFSLIGSPIALVIVGCVFFLWLILHFFREDPLVIWGHAVADWAVILGLVSISVAAFWVVGPLTGLSVGIGVGLLISVVHGLWRNPEGLFLDENDAVTNGLITSRGAGISSNSPV